MSVCQIRNWREVDVDALAANLQCSDLVTSPSDDLESTIDGYNTTLRDLIDKHVPLRIKRLQARRSARWFDQKCRESKRLTRKLEQKYRHLRTADTRAAWRQQFDAQRQLYQSKFTTFWLSTVENSQQNSRALWRTVNTMLHPPCQHATTKLTATDFANFFRSKVANRHVRAATASANPPVINPRPSTSFSQFQPATIEQITHLMSTMPAKSCPLDPIPTWLLKRLTPHIAPVICHLYNLFLHSGVFPIKSKQALVLPLMKKNNWDPETASTYRPISNLPYISKVIERVVARRFSSHLSHHSLLPARQSAYRPFRSTETAVLSYTTTWYAPPTTVKFRCSCYLI